MQLFRDQHSDALRNARENLAGRTHYVDQSTLNFHYSRVLSAQVLADGLLFAIVESVAVDPDNRRRGFRGVVFDVFGNIQSRRALDQCLGTKAAAERDMLASAAGLDAVGITVKGAAEARHNFECELRALCDKATEIGARMAAAA